MGDFHLRLKVANKMQSTDASDSIFIRIDGSPAIRALVDEFYDLIEADPAYSGVMALHGSGTADVRASLAGWLSAWLGGPRDWFEQPHPCLMGLHLSLPITADLSAQWLQAMRRALERGAIEPWLAAHQHLAKIAEAMATRR